MSVVYAAQGGRFYTDYFARAKQPYLWFSLAGNESFWLVPQVGWDCA